LKQQTNFSFLSVNPRRASERITDERDVSTPSLSLTSIASSPSVASENSCTSALNSRSTARSGDVLPPPGGLRFTERSVRHFVSR